MEKTNNLFISQALKESNVTLSGNGAKKYSTSGNDFVDNFSSISKFIEIRKFEEISKDMELLWCLDALMCLKLAVYIRLITRKSNLIYPDTDLTFATKQLEIQKGAGLKNEGILRMYWIAINHPNTFKKNICEFIAAGSWKDIFTLLSIDLKNGWNNRKLDWRFMYNVIEIGILTTPDLVKKYLPTIKTKCSTEHTKNNAIIGKWLANMLSPGCKDAYRRYRHFKSSGKAHQWQQLISKQIYDAINFDTISGRALAQLVGSKFLKNHGLENKYTEWISNKPIAKFTGYVYELFKGINSNIPEYRKRTINVQFEQLIQSCKNESSLIVVRDTSYSMHSTACGLNVSSDHIAKSLALFFSQYLQGKFANTYIEFSHKARIVEWKGETPVDKFLNDTESCVGNTDFQSVIDLFINLKNKGVPEEDFPKGLLLLSDGEFDGCGYNDSTNFQEAINKLKNAGFSKEFISNFKIILWDIPNIFYYYNGTKFEDFADAPNFFYLSGFDGSIVSFIFGNGKKVPKTAEELFLVAMDQELLNLLEI